MSAYGAVSSLLPLVGSAFGPVGSIIGGIGGAVSRMLGGASAEKKAKRANEQRYQAILNLLRTQGEASKNEVRRSGEEERGAIAQSAIGRGLYNSTVLDSLNNASLERQSRELTKVDESVADRLAGVMERRTDAYPDNQQMNAGVGALGAMIGGQASGGGQPNAINQWYNDGGLYGSIMRMMQKNKAAAVPGATTYGARRMQLNY